MKTFRNILCLLIIGFLFGCSGDVTKSASDNTSTVLGSETSRDGKVKIAKLEGSEIVISNASSDQQNPHVIYLPDKNLWFSVYEDWSSPTTGADIKGRFIKSDGTLCGSELTITNVSGNQTAPWAAYRDKDLLATPTGNDTIFVVWQDARGTTSSGYVYHKAINVSSLNTTDCSGYTLGGENTVSYNQILRYDLSTSPINNIAGETIGTGDGTVKTFSDVLSNSPIVPGTVVFKAGSQVIHDDGHGTCGTDTCSINYESGFVSVTFATAPPNLTPVTADYSYYTSFPPSTSSVGDTLLSRKSPRVAYDPVRDRFWVVWNESRSTLNRISELCFGFAPTAWQAGDTSFPGYVILDGATFAEQPSKIGVSGADIIRNAQTRTNRLISSTVAAFTETYTYEYFTNANNITAASDTTSPEDFMVWEGMRQKGVLTCSCTDNNSNKVCDLGDTVTSTFTTSNYDDGLVHIYGLFDKEVPQGTIFSKKLDTSTSNTYYPSIAFDPITKKFLVAWEDLRDGSNTKIYGQLVYSGSGLYNTNFLISCQDTDNSGSGVCSVGQDENVANSKQTKPFISYDSVNQRYFAIWQDGRNGSVSLENLDIYGQYVDAEGTLRGSNYSISTAPSNQYNPTIAYNSQKNQFLAVWKDARNYNQTTCGAGDEPCGSDIYGQRFSLGQPQLTLLKLDDTSLSPALLDFGSVTVNQFSTMSFKIRNTGDITINVDCINPMPASPFSFDNLPSQLNTCSEGNAVSLVPSAEITLTVRFSPTSSGTFNGNFTIKSDAGDRTVNFQGVGVSPDLTVQEGDGTNDGTLNFGSIKSSQTKDLVLTIVNNGTITYNITSISGVSYPFSIVEPLTYPIPMSAGSQQVITIRFSPAAKGAFIGQLVINTNQPGLSRTVNLQATALAPVLRVSPTSIDYGTVTASSTKDLPFTIYNDGDDTLSITSCGTFLTGFSLVGTCPSSVNANSSQPITIRFSPTDIISYSGSITIQTNAGNQVVTLSGQGTGGKVSISPSQIDFGTVATNSSETISVTVSNTGSASMKITGITGPLSPFSVTYTGTTPIQLLPNTSYTIVGKFSPTSAGTYSGSFAINTDAINGNQTVNLQGVGVSPNISISPSPITFPATAVNSSQSLNLVINNNGTLPVVINSIDSPLSPFSIGTTITTPYTLNAGSTLNIVIKFSPTSAGSFSSSLGILFDYATTPTLVNMTGNGTSATQAANIVFLQNGSEVTSVAFGNVFKGSQSSKTLSLRNNGTSAATINSVSVSNPAFTAAISAPFTLASGAAKSFALSFIPTSAQSYSATLTLTDASGGSYQLSLTGAGSSVNVETTTGTVSYFTALTSSQLPTSTKPSGFNISKAAEFVIEGITPNSTVTVTLTFDSLPSNPVFYKVIGNTWLLLTGYTLSGNTLTYAIRDNGPFDSDSTTGIIRDPVVVGGTGAGGGGGSISSSGGGCSIGGHQNAPSAIADLAVMLMPLLFLAIMRRRR